MFYKTFVQRCKKCSLFSQMFFISLIPFFSFKVGFPCGTSGVLAILSQILKEDKVPGLLSLNIMSFTGAKNSTVLFLQIHARHSSVRLWT